MQGGWQPDGNQVAGTRPYGRAQIMTGVSMNIENFSDGTDFLTEAWSFYEDVFADVNTLAANRHLMTYDEFEHVMADKRVQKWLALSDEGRIIGMATVTNHLESWPLVSPAYFAKHYPDQYARQAIWYIGFVGCNPEGTRAHAFRDLIARIQPQVEASNGVFVQDFCTYNVGVRRLPDATRAILRRINPTVEFGRIDAQEFWAGSFAPSNA
jgi:hypothetical protein